MLNTYRHCYVFSVSMYEQEHASRYLPRYQCIVRLEPGPGSDVTSAPFLGVEARHGDCLATVLTPPSPQPPWAGNTGRRSSPTRRPRSSSPQSWSRRATGRCSRRRCSSRVEMNQIDSPHSAAVGGEAGGERVEGPGEDGVQGRGEGEGAGQDHCRGPRPGTHTSLGWNAMNVP